MAELKTQINQYCQDALLFTACIRNQEPDTARFKELQLPEYLREPQRGSTARPFCQFILGRRAARRVGPSTRLSLGVPPRPTAHLRIACITVLYG
jgi:hypothetical protein